MDSFKKALTRKAEEIAKDEAMLRNIEKEQKAAGPASNMAGMKARCLEILGPKVYEEMYGFLKKARSTRLDMGRVQEKLAEMVGGDKLKMNMAFLIDQIIEQEAMKSICI